MADSKITDLTALAVQPDSSDVLPIVDISDTSMAATGTTKKIAYSDFLSGYLTSATASSTYLPLAGGTLSGNLNINGTSSTNGVLTVTDSTTVTNTQLLTLLNSSLSNSQAFINIGKAITTNNYGRIYFGHSSDGSINNSIVMQVGGGTAQIKIFSGAIQHEGGFYPSGNNTLSLGLTTRYYANTYTQRLYLNSTAYLDGGTAGLVNINGQVKATVGAAKAFVGVANSGNMAMSLETPGNLASDSIYFAVNNRGRVGYDGTGVLIDDNTANKRVMITSNGKSWLFDTSGHFTPPDGGNIILGATTGTKIGTSTTQKLGFFNATPVVQPASTPANATDLATALTLVNDLKSKLVTLGLIA